MADRNLGRRDRQSIGGRAKAREAAGRQPKSFHESPIPASRSLPWRPVAEGSMGQAAARPGSQWRAGRCGDLAAALCTSRSDPLAANTNSAISGTDSLRLVSLRHRFPPMKPEVPSMSWVHLPPAPNPLPRAHGGVYDATWCHKLFCVHRPHEAPLRSHSRDALPRF